jgi:hypothetical protein
MRVLLKIFANTFQILSPLPEPVLILRLATINGKGKSPEILWRNT